MDIKVDAAECDSPEQMQEKKKKKTENSKLSPERP